MMHAPHIQLEFIERMQLVCDATVLIRLLEEFVRSLQSTRKELDDVPQDCTEAVRFMAVKLRGTASEYGAHRLAEVARTMEQSLKQGSRNVIDWRLLLRSEIDDTITAYRHAIEQLEFMPASEAKLRLISGE